MLTRRNKQGAQQVAETGGMMDEAGQVVNGTTVPAGSLAEEVADDVPAMLSEGEFVVPADVVRFVGLERLMKMRDKAKEGLERMEEVGQMGNAEEVDNPDQPFDQNDDAFESEIDSILAEDGAAMQTEQMFAAGGYVSGSDVSKATQNPAVDVRYYKHSDGRVMYVTFINDKPMTAIPDGFSQVSAEDARQVGRKAEVREEAQASAASSSGDSGGGSAEGMPSGEGSGGFGVDALASTGLGLMAVGEKLGKVPSVPARLLSKVTTFAGEKIADRAIDKMTEAYDKVAAPPALPGMGTFAAKDGSISTISTQNLIDKYDMSAFGITSAQMDAERNARIADEARLAEQARQEDQARAEAAARAQANIEAAARAEDAARQAAAAEAKRAADARAAEAARARALDAQARAQAEAQAREVANNPGSWSDSQRAEAAETGMVSVGGVSVSNDATIAAQNEAMFGDSSGGDTGGNSNDGTYCCSRMVHLGEWTETKELARMHIWHHKQPEWWKAGYSVWGKVVANTLFKKKGFWTDVMNAFYARHIKNQPRTLKSTIADLVIYPGVFVCSMIWRNAPETTRYVPEDEMK